MTQKSRWDETPGPPDKPPNESATPAKAKRSRWDAVEPVEPVDAAPKEPPRSRWDETEAREPQEKRSRWDDTPATAHSLASGSGAATPMGSSRWSETPAGGSRWDETPRQSRWDETPMAGQSSALPSHLELRNRALSDAELDQMLPADGYVIVPEPAGYVPIRTPARKLMATPTPMASGFFMADDTPGIAGAEHSAELAAIGQEIPGMDGLQFVKAEDARYFGKLLDGRADEALSPEELTERLVLRLLLKIKNGTPPMRKVAMRQLTERAREFGPGPLLDQVLPLLLAPSLDGQERHLLVKVVDRILQRLGELVRPFVHKILVVVAPLLVDEDHFARVEGREVVSNLAKAAGLPTMIATLRPDIDHQDEFVRNTTARAFAVVGSALGLPSLLPFLRAVCASRKSWQARYTGLKIVQQVAVLTGCGVLPHLRGLVECATPMLEDDSQPKVRIQAALALAALAEAATPYGIESFDGALKPLWTGIGRHRGKALAAFLKAIGFVITLMDAEYAGHYTREVMPVLVREFATPDEELKKIVLRVVQNCVCSDGVDRAFVLQAVLPDFVRHFWVRRMALDRRNYRQLIDTTVQLAHKVGVGALARPLVPFLRDESEPFRKMVVEALGRAIGELGSGDVDAGLEKILVDGLLHSFQEQTVEDAVVLDGFGTVVTRLGPRVQPYLDQITSVVLWRLNNKSAQVRQQAADLVARIAAVMHVCGEEELLGNLGVILYEYLGEEFPEVLGSILGALNGIVAVIGMDAMRPPVEELLPRLTPILRNRHEKVQERCIELVGRVADRAAERVAPREWMRISFDLIELLKAHKKAIRRATVSTFGHIARAIGPQDVIGTLLSNLKVQDRQMRVCTTVAIAIVAEQCGPFTVLPALMHEYRTPELNVQNGVLKSLSFMFEYIGPAAKDYVYALATLLEDALTDRDIVHRQTACAAVKHLALGVASRGCEDVLVHLLNLVWPNVFETSPHMAIAVMEAVEALSLALGPAVLLQYVLQGLFHPARRVRAVFWRIYNMLHMLAPDALVAAYPRIGASLGSGVSGVSELSARASMDYRRYELEYVL